MARPRKLTDRALGIVERDLRKFMRSPTLLLATLVLPVLQLVILGHAIGGNIRNVRLGLVDEDHGPAVVALRERLQAVEANARTTIVVPYDDERAALRDLHEGRLGSVVIAPPELSRAVLAGHAPTLAVIEDNTDRFVSASVQAVVDGAVASMNAPLVARREKTALTVDVVELYPYVPYIRYLLPGSITLAIFMTAMIGGGILFLDDKQRGLHEGYLVTPITKIELVAGFTLSGVVKGMVAGSAVLVLGSIVAGVSGLGSPALLAELMLLTALTSTSLMSMMFLIVCRLQDPLAPRAIFGILNTLLYFPSGAMYPIAAFPPWLRWIASIDPFAYSVDGYRALLVRHAGLAAIRTDLALLAAMSLAMLGGAMVLFKRTL